MSQTLLPLQKTVRNIFDTVSPFTTGPNTNYFSLNRGLFLVCCLIFSSSTTAACSGSGWATLSGSYFNNVNLTAPAAETRSDSTISFNWGNSAPGVGGLGTINWSVRWTGTVYAATTGAYRFRTLTDDGVRLSVSGSSVITDWSNKAGVTTNTTGDQAFVAGQTYTIQMEYYRDTGTASAELLWLPPGGGGYVVVPACPAPALHHYGITLTSPGATCAGSAITISAYDSTNALVAPPNGTVITLSTSTGTGSWVGGNTATFNGSATSVVKYLQHTTAVTDLNINVTDGSRSETASLDPNITFNTSALAFYGSSSLGAMPNQVAGTADTAPILKATNCSSLISGNKSVSFGYECRNPVTCIAGQTLSVNNNNIQSNANGATISYSAAQTLNFDAITGNASIPINYSDVGKIKIYASMTLDASGNNPALTLTTSSDDFVVKPHTLVATAIQTAGGIANPGGSTASGTAAGFVSAGTAFTTKVEVRNSAGNRTPNFGNETTSENNLTLVPQDIIYPTGGTLTALSNPSVFSATIPAGTFINTTINWNQVGSFTARPELADNDYLGAGDVISKTVSATIGRFYPDHFALISSATTNSCGTFSYLSHPAIGLNYTLEAQGASNSVLTNYGGNYAAGARATPSYVAENANSGNGSTFALRLFDGTTPAWSNGVMAVASSTAYVSRILPTSTQEAPYTSLQWGLDLTESFDGGRALINKDMRATSTGACAGACTEVAIGSPLVLRYGRLRLDSSSGPETAALPVNLATEYWTGTSYVLNTLDSCTVLPRSIITYTAVSPVAGVGSTLATDTNRTIALAAGKSTTGIYQNLDVSGVHFAGGKAGHYFTTPGSPGLGTFTEGINLTTLPWLRYDWDQNGDFSDATLPNATFSFGPYRGHDRILYWRERWQ